MARPRGGGGHPSNSTEEKQQLEAVLAASAEEDRQRKAADTQLDSDTAAAIEASKELERLRIRDEADRGMAFLDAKQKLEDEEAMRKAAEEKAKVLERLAKLKAEQEETKRKAEEEESKRAAQAEEAIRALEQEEAKRKAEQLEIARQKHRETQEAKQKAQAEEEARRKAEEEEAMRKAAADAGKTWLELAVDSAGQARQLEDLGQTKQAMEQYKKSLELFGYVWKKEKSERVRAAIQEKIQDLKGRADKLSDALMAVEASQAADILAGAYAEHPRPEASERCLDAEAARAAQLLAGAKGQAGYNTDTAFAADLLGGAQDVPPQVLISDSAGSRDHAVVPGC